MTPPEFIEWLEEKIAYAEGYRNHIPKTKEENKYWDGMITAFKEVLDKTMEQQ